MRIRNMKWPMSAVGALMLSGLLSLSALAQAPAQPPEKPAATIAIFKLGLMSESDLAAALAECRAHLAKPGTSFTMYTVAQVWGRTA